MTERVRLMPREHSVYDLDDGLLLVFKPAGHTEPVHAHAYAQRLRVLRGRLRVDAAATTVVLDSDTEELLLAAGQEHATTAMEATWLIAETSNSGGRTSR
jgi:hypothetical protein